MIRHNDGVRLTMDPFAPRSSSGPYLTGRLDYAIAARWIHWVPWVRMHLLRQRQSDPAVNATTDGPEFRCLRQRHSELVIARILDDIAMRTIRRHRLDDPRLTDEVRTMLVESTKERLSKARYRRTPDERNEERLARLIRLGPAVTNGATAETNNESLPCRAPAPAVVVDLKETIRAIRQLVCERFYMREMRDPELMVRSNRRSYVLPRQIAMYVARQLTGASLQEIGREFGGRHHTTVLHSINKIDKMRRSDNALNSTIMGLMDACHS